VTWHALAACRGKDPAIFFGPDRPVDDAWADTARKVCDRCPVRAPCLAEALDAGEKYGVWGGTTPDERRQLLQATA
jgi:WhiB family redox-sensing transcriptional regulator